MSATPLLQKVDAVTVPVPDLDAGLRFYHGSLGHESAVGCKIKQARLAWGCRAAAPNSS